MRIATIAAIAMGLVSTSVSAAPLIGFDAGVGGNAAGTTVFQNFDGFTAGAQIGTLAYAYDTSTSKGATPAFGSTGNFASVLGAGSYSVSFGPADIFSFVVGSLDRYNKLTLSFANGTSLVYNGGQIIGGAGYPAGNQGAPGSNGRVTFDVNGGAAIIGATFASDTNSFEFDNLAARAVPEPTTWALMFAGFGLIATAMRRRKARGTLAAI